MKTIAEICQKHGAKGFYSHSSGLIGIRFNNLYHWYNKGEYKWDTSYRLWGTTKHRLGASWHLLA